jgi:hypothetical protein
MVSPTPQAEKPPGTLQVNALNGEWLRECPDSFAIQGIHSSPVQISGYRNHRGISVLNWL